MRALRWLARLPGRLVADEPLSEGLLAEHHAGQHDVIRHQGCELCHQADPPPAETVLGRLMWEPHAGPHGGLVYRPEPPDDSGDWIQVETATGQLIWRRLPWRS